jgi:transcriptional regulator with XRE-family HTH domain
VTDPTTEDVTNLYTTIGLRILTTRRARGLNQAALGHRIGLGRSTISNLESGRQHLAVHQLVAIAQALRIDTEDLLTGPLPELTTPTPEPADTGRPFWLQRDHDVSGVSGTGIVAHGCLWPDGTASVRWTGERPSTVFWDSIDDAIAVHGHGGHTRIVFADGGPR